LIGKMDKIIKAAKTESEWLRHYSHTDSKRDEQFEDFLFYDRMLPNGYAKVYMPLHQRCPMGYIQGLDVTDNKDIIYGPRNHDKGIYTVLEFVIYNKLPGYQEMIDYVKS